MTGDYTGSYTTTNGTHIDVTATRGKQLFGRITGTPLNDTDPGPLLIEATGTDGQHVVLVADTSEAMRLIRSIEIGIGVADTRDHNNDRFPPVEN